MHNSVSGVTTTSKVFNIIYLFRLYGWKHLVFLLHGNNNHWPIAYLIFKFYPSICFWVLSPKRWSFSRGEFLYDDIYYLNFMVIIHISGEEEDVFSMYWCNFSNDEHAQGWIFRLNILSFSIFWYQLLLPWNILLGFIDILTQR